MVSNKTNGTLATRRAKRKARKEDSEPNTIPRRARVASLEQTLVAYTRKTEEEY